MQSRTAHSLDPDASAAADDLIAGITRDGPIQPALALLFVSGKLEHRPFCHAITRQWPDVALIGCSTDGEASLEQGGRHASSLLIVLHDTTATIRTGICRGLSHGVETAVARGWAEAGGPQLCAGDLGLVFADSLHISGDAVVASLQRQAGEAFPFYGGLAADCWKFSATCQFYNGEIVSDAAVFAVLEGVAVGAGVDSGWTALTQPATITRSRANQVLTIDGTPALSWYQQYLPVVGPMLHQHPLLLQNSGNGRPSEGAMLRAPITWDAESGSITFAGDVPEGARVALTTVRRDHMRAAAQNAIAQSQSYFPADQAAEVALFFSCAARAHLLGTRTDWEVKIVSEAFEHRLPIAGAYLYGEFAPAGAGERRSCLHNESIVPLTLGDRCEQ